MQIIRSHSSFLIQNDGSWPPWRRATLRCGFCNRAVKHKHGKQRAVYTQQVLLHASPFHLSMSGVCVCAQETKQRQKLLLLSTEFNYKKIYTKIKNKNQKRKRERVCVAWGRMTVKWQVKLKIPFSTDKCMERNGDTCIWQTHAHLYTNKNRAPEQWRHSFWSSAKCQNQGEKIRDLTWPWLQEKSKDDGLNPGVIHGPCQTQTFTGCDVPPLSLFCRDLGQTHSDRFWQESPKPWQRLVVTAGLSASHRTFIPYSVFSPNLTSTIYLGACQLPPQANTLLSISALWRRREGWCTCTPIHYCICGHERS